MPIYGKTERIAKEKAREEEQRRIEREMKEQETRETIRNKRDREMIRSVLPLAIVRMAVIDLTRVAVVPREEMQGRIIDLKNLKNRVRVLPAKLR